MRQYHFSNKCLSIALIGCGSVGVGFLYQLFQVKDNYKKITIFIFNPKKDLASGYAYTTTNNDFLLNADNTEMSIDPHNDYHFITWLKINGYHSNNQLSSRKVFGKYLKHNLDLLLHYSDETFQVEHIAENVEDCWTEADNSFYVKTASAQYTFNIGVFSHGAIQNTMPVKISSHDKFIDNIYNQPNLLEEISDGAKILLLGSSLTMVDASLLLKNHNKAYMLTNASRSGYFPETIFNNTETNNPILLDLPVNDISELILYININLSYLLNRWYDVNLEIVKYEFSNHRPRHNHEPHSPHEIDMIYQFCLKLDIVMDSLFPMLSRKQLNLFHKIEKYFGRYLSGIPKVNSDKLRNFWNESSFNIQQLEMLQPASKGFEAKFHRLSDTIKFDNVINCSGLKGIYFSNNKANALSQNIIKRHQFKINHHAGLQTSEKTGNVIRKDNNKTLSNIYAIGESKIGSRRMCCDFAFHVKNIRNVLNSMAADTNFENLHS